MTTMETVLVSGVVLAFFAVGGCGSDPEAGAQGERGPVGAVGAAGAEGPAGAQGELGAAGKDGAPGAAGKDGADGAKDGSRLHALHFVADDGAQIPAGWLDTQLGVECYFGPASDGQTRCLPLNGFAGGEYFFDNAACSGAPTVIGTKPGMCKALTKYTTVASVVPGVCGYKTDVFETGAAVSPSVLYQPSGQCHQASAATIAAYTQFNTVTAVDPATLVAGSKQ